MQFKITLKATERNSSIPINYQYPLSAAIYKIIAKGNGRYAEFLHDTGYGRGFKFFTFSDIRCPFEIKGDRLCLKNDELTFAVCLQVPEAMESFIKGLFTSEKIDIADHKSKASFQVVSVETLPNLLALHKDNEIVSIQLKPLSPIVAGIPNDKGIDDYLSPDDPRFIQRLLFNWHSKIKDYFGPSRAMGALLLMDLVPTKQPFKSRLITIKAETDAETKIRGWVNLELKVTAEKRFVELLLNGGMGLYNAQGMGCVTIESRND